MRNGNVALQHLSACSDPVLNTLENLIAPGGRARLSPYVEAAQLLSLFNELPSPTERKRVTDELIRKNEGYIQDLAKRWANFCSSGKSFREADYSDKSFLEAYLIYYFSVNVAKIQVTLLDLLREGELTNDHLELADIGVGAGTSVVAVLDFLLAWKTVCDLYDVDFPIQTISLHGFDCNQTVLSYASKVTKSYGKALSQRSIVQQNSLLSLLVEATENVRWQVIDLESASDLPQGVSPTLLIAGNILNELSHTGQNNLANIIRSLPENGVALLIEPGSKSKASALMEWRHSLPYRTLVRSSW